MGKLAGILFLSLFIFVSAIQKQQHFQKPIIAEQEKINIKQYLKNGYVVSLLPASSKEIFSIDENEKYVKAEYVDEPRRELGDNYYEFIPVFEASIFPNAAPVPFNTSCFSNYTAQVTSFTDTEAQITISAKGKTGLFCSDSLLVASRESVHFFDFFLAGDSDAKFSYTNANESLDIQQNGFQVFLLPDGYLKSVLDIWQTYQLFVGKHSFQDGIELMEDHMNITFVTRTTPNFVPDESEIMDGDYFAIFGPSNTSASSSLAVASLISLGTGGRTSHVTVALRINGTLYILESCGKGVIRTEYQTWMNKIGPENMISILRLRDDLRASFNSSAAAEFFSTVEGLPYGNENFVFGWVDTVDGNYPTPLSSQEIPALLILGDSLYHDAVNLGVAEGLNQRLGTNNLTVTEILYYCDAKNISIVDVVAMPELESFVYPNPPGPRMVCDVFAMKLYKAAGVFGDLEFEATELTPKDTYQLQIFAPTWERPQGCSGDSTPGICQISGMYWLDLPDFNTITPYAHMNERCAAVPTEYIRTPVGC